MNICSFDLIELEIYFLIEVFYKFKVQIANNKVSEVYNEIIEDFDRNRHESDICKENILT
jgi:hypothetical protein